ncbi:MAG: ABC transporter ATP-binding protein [Nitrospiraceae bacterium]|nr:ABC transporter ATP-binding protein [Nitrospiraceae bacterium]
MADASSAEDRAVLEVSSLVVKYRSVPAVKGVDFKVNRGAITTLLGANGAGKTTTLNALAGILRISSGEVLLDGEPVAGLPTHELVRRGIALVPEGRRVVAPLSVWENLQLSGYGRGSKPVDFDVLDLFPRLAERRRQLAGLLSGGEQQMLAIARALMTSPRVLLLDEPSMGLAPAVIDTVFEAIWRINQTGLAVLLVEQNAAASLPIAKDAYVLQQGEMVMHGTAEEMLADPKIADTLLGIEQDDRSGV